MKRSRDGSKESPTGGAEGRAQAKSKVAAPIVGESRWPLIAESFQAHMTINQAALLRNPIWKPAP